MFHVQIVNLAISMITTAVCLMLGRKAWQQHDVPAAQTFVPLALVFAWIALWNTAETLAGNDMRAYETGAKLEYAGAAMLPVIWLRFSLRFSERTYPKMLWTGLSIIPLLTILFTASNDFHGLMWAEPQLTSAGIRLVYGTWFWTHAVYSNSLLVLGSIMLARHVLNNPELGRMGGRLVLAAVVLPLLGNMLSMFYALNPFPGISVSTLLMGVSVVSLASGLLQLKLLDIAPSIYRIILNNVPAGLVVVDLRNHNLATRDKIKNPAPGNQRDLMGQELHLTLPLSMPTQANFQQQVDRKGRFELQDQSYEVTVSPAYASYGKVAGTLLVMTDVTAATQVEKARQAEREFANMVNHLGAMLNGSLDVKQITATILESLAQLVPNTRLNIMLVDEDGFTTRVHQQHGYATEAVAIQEFMVFDYRISPMFTQSLQAPSLYIPPALKANPSMITSVEQKAQAAVATISIMADDKPIGFINIDCPEPNTLTPEVADRVRIFGQQAALAIKNAKLYEKTRKQAEELKNRVNSLMIAQQVYKDIGFSNDIKALVKIILDAALRIAWADAGYVALMKDGKLEPVEIYGNYDQNWLETIVQNREGIIQPALAEQRTVMLQAPVKLTSAYSDAQAQAALPLFMVDANGADYFYGVIVLETSKTIRFTEDRLQLLNLISDRASVALQNAELVKRVRERADELEVLYSKVSYLEKFKTNMIEIAAHDLKNPLTVIQSYLLLLTDSPDLVSHTDTIYPAMLRSTDRMIQIVQNFLSMERIEQAAKLETMRPFDLSKLVAQAIEEFTPQAQQKSQTVGVMLPHNVCMVRGDSVQIYEAISNFFTNAIKYTPEHGHIHVALEENGEMARLEIADNGYGIPEDQQAKMFQPFYRAQTEETASIEGTGLGLHLTKTIIEQQQGEIIFSSVYGEGSSFGFKLPLYLIEAEDA